MREEDIAFLRKNREKCERKCCFFVSLASVIKKRRMYMLSILLTAAATAEKTTNELSRLQVFAEQMYDWGINAGKHLISAIIIFIVGRFLISFLQRMVANIMIKKKVDPGIQSFVRNVMSILLTILLVVAIIGKLGIETTSFAALLASAGVAIGMALSGNLQNFAGGLIILILRPFKVGDWIESQGQAGTVREILIFHTLLTTADNKVIYIPNGSLCSGTIVNYSREENRRVEWIVGVEYGEDYDKVEKTVRSLIAAEPRILTTPEPYVALHALDASSVNVVIRVWVKTSDYWNVYFDMNKNIYAEFNKEGIGFPFPQLTVHQAAD